MTITKTVLAAALLAVVLLAGPASAQAPPTDSADERVTALEELAESQESLIRQQQTLIDEQEALLNAYRCMFKVDVELVPGGCPGPVLSEEEVADGELLCAGWLAERDDTARRIVLWTAAATMLDIGVIAMDNPILQQTHPMLNQYYTRVSAIIPSLKSDRLIRLMGAMADDIKTVSDTYTRGAPANEMVAVIFAAIDQLGELDAAIGEICGAA